MYGNQRNILFVLLFIVIVAFSVRLPRMTYGYPYFYDEDEAHHFNRVVNMVKSGDLNPHYFLKPSLHFYLRIPGVIGGFLAEVRRGNAKTIDEVVTKDPFGVGDYSFSASHKLVVAGARSISLFLGVGTVILTFLLGLEFGLSVFLAAGGALFVACSPPLVEYSGIVGVDILVCFFALLTVYGALRTFKQKSSWEQVLGISLLAGLTISSKYNAFPIAGVPILLTLLTGVTWQKTLGLGVGLIGGFFLGTPFAITSLPLFVNHLAYETWHYGIAGHEHHLQSPGVSHLFANLSWLASSALGWPLLLIGMLSAFFLVQKKEGILLGVFAVLYLCFMSLQKAFFPRNLLVLVPFVVIAGALFLQRIKNVRIQQSIGLIVVFFFFVNTGPWKVLQTPEESRLSLSSLLTDKIPPFAEVVLDGKLQPAPTIKKHPRVVVADLSSTEFFSYWNKGFDYAVVPGRPEQFSSENILETLPGVSPLPRIVQNPAMVLLRLSSMQQKELPLPEVILLAANHNLPCEPGREGVCWLSQRQQLFKFSPTPLSKGLRMEVMSPWEHQTFTLGGTSCPLLPGEWKSCTFPLSSPSDTARGEITEVHSPELVGVGKDPRRLGVAIRAVSFIEE